MDEIIGIVVGIFLLFPLGVWVGYRWRDRISQQHRELLRETSRRSRRHPRNISKAKVLDIATSREPPKKR
jgi:hypothetical protein